MLLNFYCIDGLGTPESYSCNLPRYPEVVSSTKTRTLTLKLTSKLNEHAPPNLTNSLLCMKGEW